jgi:hypothetical protein
MFVEIGNTIGEVEDNSDDLSISEDQSTLNVNSPFPAEKFKMLSPIKKKEDPLP